MKTNQQIKIQDYLTISDKQMTDIITFLKLSFFGKHAINQLELQRLLISKEANDFFDSALPTIILEYMERNFKADDLAFLEYAENRINRQKLPFTIVYNNTASISNITRHHFKNSYFLN